RRGWPVRTSATAASTARNSASTAPLPSAVAFHWWSPEAMTTAPRLFTFEPDVTVQRARWSVSAGSAEEPEAGGGGVVIGSPPGRRRRRGGHRRRREVSLVAAAELRAGLPDRVFEGIGQGLRGGRDDVRVAAHRRPFPRPVARIDDHPGPGGRRRVAVEDPDLVVVQVDSVELGIEGPERLAQRRVQRVDRSVAVGRGVQDLARDLDLDGGLREE